MYLILQSCSFIFTCCQNSTVFNIIYFFKIIEGPHSVTIVRAQSRKVLCSFWCPYYEMFGCWVSGHSRDISQFLARIRTFFSYCFFRLWRSNLRQNCLGKSYRILSSASLWTKNFQPKTDYCPENNEESQYNIEKRTVVSNTEERTVVNCNEL